MACVCSQCHGAVDCYQRYIKGIEKKGIKEEGGRRGGGGEEIDTTDSYRHFLLFFSFSFVFTEYLMGHGQTKWRALLNVCTNVAAGQIAAELKMYSSLLSPPPLIPSCSHPVHLPLFLFLKYIFSSIGVDYDTYSRNVPLCRQTLACRSFERMCIFF